MSRPSWARGSRVLYVGGTIHSSASPFATAMLVDDGVVAWLGEDSAAHAYRDVAERIVHLDGALVAPGFVDAHVHATSTGLLLGGLDLTGSTSLREMLDAVATYVRSHPGEPVVGHGWDDSRWPERRPPTRAEIDRAAGSERAYLSRIDVHSAVVSSALVDTVPGVRERPGYDPDGPLTRAAHHAVREAMLSGVVPGARRAAQRATRRHAAELGVVAVHEMAGPSISSADDLADLIALAETEPGPLVAGYWGQTAADGGIDAARELGAVGVGGDLFVDGSLGSHTAWLAADYADAPGDRGQPYLDVQQIRSHLVAATDAGLQAGFHVIGDAACAAVADGLRQAAADVGPAALRLAGHRLEHAEMLDDAAAGTCVELGVALSMQPVFDALWGGPDGMYAARLGTERAGSLNRFADLVAAGAVLAFGSDAPVTPVGPWAAVRAAMHHRTPASGVTARAAFSAHTRGGWRAAGQHGAGVLAPGAPAHVAIWAAGPTVVQTPDARVVGWSTDPRSGTPGLPELGPDLPLPRCLRTLVHGTAVHDTGDLADESLS
ncbi:MAG: amidohydrolase family protein [Candidatus Nanopelagicales bacterium]